MNKQIFDLIKYDLNGHWRSQKVTFMFVFTLTYVLMDNILSLFMFTSENISFVPHYLFSLYCMKDKIIYISDSDFIWQKLLMNISMNEY